MIILQMILKDYCVTFTINIQLTSIGGIFMPQKEK